MRSFSAAIVAVGLVGCQFNSAGIAFDEDAALSATDAFAGTDAPTGPDALNLDDAALPDAPPPDAPLSDASNLAGTALSFDGVNDFVSVSRQVAADFTIEAWIKSIASRSGLMHYQGLSIAHADVANNADDFGTAILNGHFAFGTGNPDTTIESTTTVTTGAWVHVAATRDQSTGIIRVYVNGTEETMVNTTNTNSLSAATNIAIGGNTVDSRFFDGTIDEVRIWNTVRTGAELVANMNVQLNGSEAGLVNYWRLDDGSGTTATDAAGTNDGSLGAGSPSATPSWVASDAPIF